MQVEIGDMQVLIIEDDPSSVLSYEIALNGFEISDFDVCSNASDAFNKILTNPPDFIIVDIFLKGEKTGIDLIREINERNIPIIIVTGFPEEKLFKEAVDLKAHAFLVKPINQYELKFEIGKIIERIQDDSHCIFIKEKGRRIRIELDDIIFLETEGNYTTFITDTRKHVLKKSLSKIMKKIGGDLIIQVHRSHSVNLGKIASINSKKQMLKTTSGHEIPIGKNYENALKLAMDENYLNF